MTTFGERLRNARKAAGLSAEALAERLGVSRPYISSLENDKRNNPALSLLVKASEVLGVSCGYLLGMNLPGASEIGFHLHVRGKLHREDYERQHLAMDRLCTREGIDPLVFCAALGLPFGDIPPERLVDPLEEE